MVNSVNTHNQNLQQNTSGQLHQLQRLIMLPQMQQAIHVMQMPVMELQPLIEFHIAQNPVIEFDENESNDDIENLESECQEEETDLETPIEKELDFNDRDFEILKQLDKDFQDTWTDEVAMKPARTSEDDRLQTFSEQSITAVPSLFEHLMAQAHDTFDDAIELKAAELIIGNLNEYGYLQASLKEICAMNQLSEDLVHKVLQAIQGFDPYGVGAESLQESLLIQLKCLGKEKSLAFAIIQNHYDHLLHNRIPLITQNLHCTSEEIAHAIQHDISHLDLRPGTTYAQQMVQNIVPDVTLRQEGEELIVGINDDFLPPLRINSQYMKLIREDALKGEEKQYIQQHINAAKWLVKNIAQRNSTLKRITEVLLKRQKEFFQTANGKLVPLTMKSVADELEMHESTVARAVSNKYIDCPRGLLALKSFFNNSYTTESGQNIASTTVQDLLKEMIAKEDRRHPLSDAALSDEFKKRGITCARRTVAKYRTELNLGNAQQRRQFS